MDEKRHPQLRDQVPHSDGNVPCQQGKITQWRFIDAAPTGARRLFAWVPEKIAAQPVNC